MTEAWEEIDRARTISGDELILRRRAGVYEIRCNGWDLMSNRAHASEQELARLALKEVLAPRPHILIGGLGMGFTLRAALDASPPESRIDVAELLPEIVAWNEGALAMLSGRPLRDKRVGVQLVDVAELMVRRPILYDAILLDVDNGPNAVMYGNNAQLYSRQGVEIARNALAPDGVLAIWSADRSSDFEDQLGGAFFSWRAVDTPARSGWPSPLHVIYLAKKSGSPSADSG